MSLINDALRRASNASRGASDAPVAEPPPLPEAPVPITEDMLAPPPPPHPMLDAGDGSPPVIALDSGGEYQEKSSKKGLVIAMLFVLVVAGACGFSFWKKHRAARVEIAAKAKKSAIHSLLATPQIASNKLAKIEARSPMPDSINKSITSTSAAVPVAAPVAPPKPPVAPAVVANSTPAKFPPLRLQSIFYRPPNPSVMINGKLLCVSDEIQGVLVADIQPSSVTLVLSGYTNVLTLR